MFFLHPYDWSLITLLALNFAQPTQSSPTHGLILPNRDIFSYYGYVWERGFEKSYQVEKKEEREQLMKSLNQG